MLSSLAYALYQLVGNSALTAENDDLFSTNALDLAQSLIWDRVSVCQKYRSVELCSVNNAAYRSEYFVSLINIDICQVLALICDIASRILGNCASKRGNALAEIDRLKCVAVIDSIFLQCCDRI